MASLTRTLEISDTCFICKYVNIHMADLATNAHTVETHDSIYHRNRIRYVSTIRFSYFVLTDNV